MDTVIDDLWREFCKIPTEPIKGHRFLWPDFYWYSEASDSALEDFQMCQQDADHGNEYAQKRMVKFLTWRMQR